MSRTRHTLVLLAALVSLAAAASAHASPGQVIRDCAEDGKLDRKYSNSDLKKARKKLPSDLDEYSDCREVISAGISSHPSGGGHHGGSGGGSGGHASNAPAAPTPDDQSALDKVSGKKPPPLDVGGEKVEPGKGGIFDLASAEQDVPLPLLVALIAVGLLALAGGAYALRRRIPALAGFSLRSRLSSLRGVPFLRRRR